jgi:hypothetical protein
MYTSCGPQKTELILEHKLVSNPSTSEKSTLSKQTLLSLAARCNRTSFYFHYRGIFYRLIYGLSMGAPLSPIQADIFMEDLQKRAILQSFCKPEFWVCFKKKV